MSGKSTWVKRLLMDSHRLIQPSPTRVIWLYKRWQPMYSDLLERLPMLEFQQGIPRDKDFFLNPHEITLIVIDDLMKDATRDSEICELFTEGSHHRNLSVICLMQNIFNKGRENRTMNLNTQYMALFKNPRDQQQISILGRQMYPNNSKHFLDIFRKSVEKPFGYLLVDLKQNTPESQRLRTNIFKTNTEPLRNQSELDDRGVNMDQPKYSSMEKKPHCNDCGIMFDTPYDLQRHVKSGCPMDESMEEESESELDQDIEDDDSGFNIFINEIYDQTDEQFKKKVDQLFIDNGDITEKEARDEASEIMMPRYRSMLLKKYKKIIIQWNALRSSKLHRDIVKKIYHLEQNTELIKAISLVLGQDKSRFDYLFDDEDGETEEESSDADSE